MSNNITRGTILGYSVALAAATLPGCKGKSTVAPSSAASSAPTAFDELIDYDAVGLAQLIKQKDISPLELLEVVMRRIEASNSTLNFMATPAYERAREKASLFSIDSPFAGAPILMKDMIDVGGVRRTDGSRLLENNIPQNNVAYTDGVERAGLNILGMTNVPELASFVITTNEMFGATRNPWYLDYSTFSSSGGAAAAVAAGVTPMAHGTDGAGSCRLPATSTGIFGMKPSRFRMLSGEVDGSHDQAKTNQVVSRTVRDSAVLMDYTEDQTGDVFAPIGLVNGPSAKRLKVGFIANHKGMMAIEPAVSATQQKTAKLLEQMSHNVAEASLPVNVEEMYAAYMAFFAAKVGGLKSVVEEASGKPLLESGLLTPLLASNIEYSLSNYTEEQMQKGAEYLAGLPAVFNRVFAEYDLLLAPVSPVAGVKLNEATINDTWSEKIARFMMARMEFTAPVNFSGIPAMSVPASWPSDSGMPIGSHFMAARGSDKMLYELAFELEEAKSWKGKWGRTH